MTMASFSSRSQTASSSRPYSSPFASSSAANFSPSSSPLTARSCDLSLRRSSPSSPPSPSSSVRFSVEKRRSMTVTKKQRSYNNGAVSSNQKRTCMCSPTTHAGSFRCAYHKRLAEQKQKQEEQHQTPSFHSSSRSPSPSNGNKLNLRRSAMKNSLVRIGGVEGELVRRALTTLIRPSSHHQRRREAFQPRPSRLSLMSKAQDS